MSSKILSPHLLLIYTCQHSAVISCFALHSPLLYHRQRSCEGI